MGEYLTSSLDRPFSKEKCNPSDADLGLYGSTATLNSLKREKDFQKIEILLWIIALTLCGFIVFILYFKYIKLNKPVPLLEKKKSNICFLQFCINYFFEEHGSTFIDGFYGSIYG